MTERLGLKSKTNKTPSQEFMVTRKQKTPFVTTKGIKHLPVGGGSQFITSLAKITVSPDVVRKFQERKVNIISKKVFKNGKRNEEDNMFGTIRIPTGNQQGISVLV